MIQRKQTIYLFLAFVAIVCCLCMQVGSFEPVNMGTSAEMYNLFVISDKDGAPAVWPLFTILLVVAPVTLVTIFLFKKRKVQARLCVVCQVLCLAWCIAYAVMGWGVGIENTTFHPAFAAVLPVCAMILLALARAGILADERLVRAADRIR